MYIYSIYNRNSKVNVSEEMKEMLNDGIKSQNLSNLERETQIREQWPVAAKGKPSRPNQFGAGQSNIRSANDRLLAQLKP